MKKFEITLKNKGIILALGAESAGNFSVSYGGKIYFSSDFGNLLDEHNFKKYKYDLKDFLKKNKITPNIVLTDLHPDYVTTRLGQALAEKHKAKNIQVQHHIAHIYAQTGGTAAGHQPLVTSFYGIALDGTGYGLDGKIWGGECFALSNFQIPTFDQFPNSDNKIFKQKIQIKRIGHLENQVMIGGELAIREPARMLLAILARIKNHDLRFKSNKDFIFHFIKKYYSRNQFELLYNQLEQNFNCQETSSAGRALDAVSVLLGFAKNERNFKHQATHLLEKNSTKSYRNLKPKISEIQNSKLILNTTYLFEYLLKNLHKDKKRLAATAQLYIAEGLNEIIKLQDTSYKTRATKKIKKSNSKPPVILSGGISNNKIISNYFASMKVLENKKPLIARGDAGLSVGQILYYLSMT